MPEGSHSRAEIVVGIIGHEGNNCSRFRDLANVRRASPSEVGRLPTDSDAISIAPNCRHTGVPMDEQSFPRAHSNVVPQTTPPSGTTTSNKAGSETSWRGSPANRYVG